MAIYFTEVEDNFLRENIDTCRTLYCLTEMFNEQFPNHPVKYGNLQKRLSKLGIKKGTHCIRKEKVHFRNAIGTIISSKDGKKVRIKTENGYVSAHKYFLENHFGITEGYNRYAIVHLNGDLRDFSENNIECVTRSIYSSMQWRQWFFTNPQLTKCAILTAQLLEFFPDLRHNENQFYKMRNDD